MTDDWSLMADCTDGILRDASSARFSPKCRTPSSNASRIVSGGGLLVTAPSVPSDGFGPDRAAPRAPRPLDDVPAGPPPAGVRHADRLPHRIVEHDGRAVGEAHRQRQAALARDDRVSSWRLAPPDLARHPPHPAGR